MHRTANSCKKDAADLLAELDRFQEAIALYDEVASYSLQSNLTKYSVKDYWLRAGLCALAMQVPFALLFESYLSDVKSGWGLSRTQSPLVGTTNDTPPRTSRSPPHAKPSSSMPSSMPSKLEIPRLSRVPCSNSIRWVHYGGSLFV